MNVELWRRLQAFALDDPTVDLQFSQRLASESGWSHAYAHRVIEEYKRFLYLAVEAGHPVTPSDEVDQVWHLHLCYTRSYWQELCEKVLQQPLHHGPTAGGPAERAKYHDWYEKTLSSYLHEFDRDPPPDIWPVAAVRFGGTQFRRGNLSHHLLVPHVLVFVAVALVTFFMAFESSWLDISEAVIFALLVAVVLSGIVMLMQQAIRRRRDPGGTDRGRYDGGGPAGGCSDMGCGSDSGGGGGGCGGGGCGGD